MRELRKETEISIFLTDVPICKSTEIRNERTPKGDGNITLSFPLKIVAFRIRNERTPKGDGSQINTIVIQSDYASKIRNERTPKGDGSRVVPLTNQNDKRER